MNRTSILFGVLIAAAWSSAAVSVPASDLTGVKAVIEKVVIEPADGVPERVQIWGAFIIEGPRDGRLPQRGYLYLGLPPFVLECSTCPPRSQASDNARNEWADLKSVAGTGEGVAFGGRFFRGRVRPASETPQSPDPYPVFMGVAKLGTHPDVVMLRQALRAP